MPHLLCHGASVCNGHLRRPVTFTPTAERLALKRSQLASVAAGIRTHNLPLVGRTPWPVSIQSNNGLIFLSITNFLNIDRRYMAEILSTRRKTLSIQSINQSYLCCHS